MESQVSNKSNSVRGRLTTVAINAVASADGAAVLLL